MTDSIQHGLQELRKKPHWSFSRINALANYCSLAWAFRYVYREEPVFTPANLVFGSVFHSVLSFCTSRRVGQRECTEYAELFDVLLRDRVRAAEPPVKFSRGEDVAGLVASGQEMIRAYIDTVDPEEKIMSIGLPFSVPLIDASGRMLDKPLIGEFDLTVKRDGVYTVVDWKTSARRWPKDRARTDLQPTCYLWAHFRGAGDSSARFRFDVVTKTKTPVCEQHVTERGPDDFVRLAERVKVLERTVENECFQPADGSWECRNCPYISACRSWHREKSRRTFTFADAA